MMSLWPGYRFGPYRIEEEIGRGGQAVVYRASREGSAATALKVLPAEVGDDPTVRARLAREVEAVRGLRHPSIVAVEDAGEVDGQLFLCMPLVEGVTLEQAIRAEGGLDPVRAVAILRRVATALGHAHAHGVVHRDVKPANVLLGRDGQAYLTDFGLAQVAEAARLTRTGVWVGTLDYIAPEQLLAQKVGPGADVYALAAVAYETLAGRPPFVRHNTNDLIQAHLNDAPRPPSALRRSLAPADAPLARGLAKSPDERHASAGDLVEDLATALGVA